MKAKKFTLISFLLLGMSLSAAAQERVIKFTLNREAQVGRIVLVAGSYRLTVYRDPSLMAVFSPEDGRGPSVMALPVSYDYTRTCSSDSLTFVPNGKGFELRTVCFADSALAIYFSGTGKSKAQVAQVSTDSAALAGAQ
jgi:hypothetical protein